MLESKSVQHPQVESISQALVQAVRERGRLGLLGARAGYVVKQVDPTFDPRKYGVTKFSEFVAEFVPAIRPLGTSGLDIVYGLAEWSELEAAPTGTSADAWRVWASPNSRQVIVVNRQSLQPRVSIAGTAGTDDVEIHPVRPDDLVGIARSFLQSESAKESDQAAELANALTSHPESWWRVWQATMGGTHLHSEWLAFRFEGLRNALLSRLVTEGLGEAEADAVVREIRRVTRSSHAVAPTNPQRHRTSHQARLSDLVHRVIDQMTDDELRRLSLPLGWVLDAMRD